MSDYRLTIGLEIHAQLKTQTKMFCDSKNDPDERKPNTNICPVCMGYPGTLPVINREAVRSVLKVGAALDGVIADYTEFDRKNYFYPDIPKGYQISQYKYPLVSGGKLSGIDITRIHLEEDTARSSHVESGDSLVDFNRAGVPLMELVTEPVMHTPEEAGNFARELQLLLTYLGVSDANMEKGEMRVEANISVSKNDQLGTKVEVKNINSFKACEKAIAFEFDRHVDFLEKGEEIKQETRGWDENKSVTFSQREKEESHDYRYFPDPDLPKLYISEISEFNLNSLKKDLPVLPEEYRKVLKDKYSLKDTDVEIFINNIPLREFFESSADGVGAEVSQTISNYILSDLGDVEETKVEPGSVKELAEMVVGGELSSRGAKDILSILKAEGGSAREAAVKNNLMQNSNPGELKPLVEKIINENESVVDDYKSGKEASLQYLVGQAMKETRGSGNPQVIKKLIEELI